MSQPLNIGIDFSTGSSSAGALLDLRDEFFSSVKMRGATTWHGAAAFDWQEVPGLLLETVEALREKSLPLPHGQGALSISIRQHDLILLGADDRPLIPALSWQADLATKEVEELEAAGVEKKVGPVAARFILAKLKWVLRQDESLKEKIRLVMTTGDWINYMLTGVARLGSSDALSNGLLLQKNKELAGDVLKAQGFKLEWFPPVIPSGQIVGKVGEESLPFEDKQWKELRSLLAGFDVISCLGDNHASGLGLGIDPAAIGMSLGNSGTVFRRSPAHQKPLGKAAAFEFHDDRLLLHMLDDCCQWYDRFVSEFARGYEKRLDELNDLALQTDPKSIRRVPYDNGKVTYSPEFRALSLEAKVASMQFSIAFEMLLRVQAMLEELPDSAVKTFVLTGGLSQSLFMQHLFSVGCRLLVPQAEVVCSAREGQLRFQTAVLGALLNSALPRHGNLDELIKKMCPRKECPRPSREAEAALSKLFREHGLLA
jgi:sugar (pentulose or hexulose) kinase